MKNFYKSVMSILLVTPIYASAAVDLVTNGSFEADLQDNGSWNLYSTLVGWSGAPDIELRNNVAGSAFDGSNFIELDTYSNSSISQLLTGTPGLYQLSFWYSARPGTGSDTNDLSFTLDGSTPVTVLTGVGGGSHHNWQNYSALFNFDGEALLTFSAAGRSDSLGGSLDMISMTSTIPEPKTVEMMLVGFLLLSFALSRTRNILFSK
ncbi:MAG: pyruvate-binding protein [Nitrosomonas sp.]|nr:pyruvate-binding protein [Nitrosomonas sp.]MBP6076879.1 pyruvate-binding protein [Nitrosomonas sp.]